MHKNDCKYIVEKVFEITPEVIELIGKYYFDDSPSYKPKEVIDFLCRNNLKFNTDTICKIQISLTNSLIPSLGILKNIITIFNTFNNAVIIRTPKMNVLSFDECSVCFENDLLKSISCINKSFFNFKIKYEYENDVLKYKNYYSAKCHKNVFYYHINEDEYREFHTSRTAGLDYIRVVHYKNSKKVFSSIESSYSTKSKSFYDQNETMIRSGEYVFHPTYNEQNKITKLVHTNNSGIDEISKFKYDKIGNVIFRERDHIYGHDEYTLLYEFKDNTLKNIYINNLLLFCSNEEEI